MGNRVKISKHQPSVFQGRLRFSAPTISLSHEHYAEAHVLRTLVVMLAALLCAYVYFVSASVLNVIARKEALSSIDTMQSSISSLEQNYFALSQGITPAMGATLGLSQVATPNYVHRPGSTAAATIVRNEI